jgi:hypothetical protein
LALVREALGCVALVVGREERVTAVSRCQAGRRFGHRGVTAEALGWWVRGYFQCASVSEYQLTILTNQLKHFIFRVSKWLSGKGEALYVEEEASQFQRC